MSRMYTCQFNAVAVTVAQDLFEIIGATGKILRIHSIELEQSTEVGDAQEEQLGITLKYGAGSVTSGSGGSSVTPAKIEQGDAAASFTCKANNTTKMAAGSGTITTQRAWTWNVRIPFNKIFTERQMPVIGSADRMTIELVAAPTDSVTMNGTVVVEEIG